MRSAVDADSRHAVTQEVKLRLLQNLGGVVQLSPGYFETEFTKDFGQRIAHIPDENLKAPRLSIALPILEGLGYSLEEPNLKEMYLRLLATASDARTPDAAHPAFAAIVSQLSGAEAGMLFACMRRDELPVVRLQRHAPTKELSGSAVLVWHLMNLVHPETGGPVEFPLFALWADNWVRLGLVAVDYLENISEPGAYDWANQRPELRRLSAESLDRAAVELGPGVLRSTEFGRKFAAAVGTPDQLTKNTSEPRPSSFPMFLI